MKKNITLISLFSAALLLVGSGCAFDVFNFTTIKTTTSTPSSVNVVETNSIKTVSTPEVSPTINYKNEKYGFELTFPDAWRGYTAKPRVLDWGMLGISDSVDFGFGERDSLFNISVHSKIQWKNFASQL